MTTQRLFKILKIGVLLNFYFANILQSYSFAFAADLHPVSRTPTQESSRVLTIGSAVTLDLQSAPDLISVSDPQAIEVKRKGISNSIDITAKTVGRSQILVQYPNKSKKIFKFKTVPQSLPQPSDGQSSSSLQAAPMQDLDSLKDIHFAQEGEVLLLYGELKTLKEYEIIRLLINQKHKKVTPSYKISDELWHQILPNLKQEITLMGENNIEIQKLGTSFFLTGTFENQDNRKRFMDQLSNFLPGLWDSSSSQIGSSDMVQLSFQFLEVAKGESLKFGTNLQPWELANPLVTRSKEITQNFQITKLDDFVHAMQQKDQVKQIAKPVVIGRLNETGSFLAGGEIPLAIESDSKDKSKSITNVVFKQYGLSLQYLPKAGPRDELWIDLKAEFSDIDESLRINGYPSVKSRKMETKINLKQNEICVFSGLVQSSNSKGVQQIPILGSLPIIGELFKSRRFQDKETELWIAMTASRNTPISSAKISGVIVND